MKRKEKEELIITKDMISLVKIKWYGAANYLKNMYKITEDIEKIFMNINNALNLLELNALKDNVAIHENNPDNLEKEVKLNLGDNIELHSYFFKLKKEIKTLMRSYNQLKKKNINIVCADSSTDPSELINDRLDYLINKFEIKEIPMPEVKIVPDFLSFIVPEALYIPGNEVFKEGYLLISEKVFEQQTLSTNYIYYLDRILTHEIIGHHQHYVKSKEGIIDIVYPIINAYTLEGWAVFCENEYFKKRDSTLLIYNKIKRILPIVLTLSRLYEGTTESNQLLNDLLKINSEVIKRIYREGLGKKNQLVYLMSLDP